jgi:chromatin segregation and condensation protein Rec8/ScpA/Scc1 (kleisin family)
MLELVKNHEVLVEQAEPWGPIVCRTAGPATRVLVPVAIDTQGSTA